MARTSPRQQLGNSLQALPVFWRDFFELEVTHSVPDPRGGRKDETHLTPHRVNKDMGRDNTRQHAKVKITQIIELPVMRITERSEVQNTTNIWCFQTPPLFIERPALSAILWWPLLMSACNHSTDTSVISQQSLPLYCQAIWADTGTHPEKCSRCPIKV